MSGGICDIRDDLHLGIPLKNLSCNLAARLYCSAVKYHRRKSEKNLKNILRNNKTEKESRKSLQTIFSNMLIIRIPLAATRHDFLSFQIEICEDRREVKSCGYFTIFFKNFVIFKLSFFNRISNDFILVFYGFYFSILVMLIGDCIDTLFRFENKS